MINLLMVEKAIRLDIARVCVCIQKTVHLRPTFHYHFLGRIHNCITSICFVAAEILDEIAKAKFTDPTPIQVRKVQFHPPNCGCHHSQSPSATDKMLLTSDLMHLSHKYNLSFLYYPDKTSET